MFVNRLSLFLLMATIFVGCNRADNSTELVKKEAKEAIEATESFFAKQKQTFETDTKKSLEGLRAALKKLEVQVGEASDAVKEKFERGKVAVEDSLDRVENDVGELKDKSEDTWESYVESTAKSLKSAKEKIQNLKANLEV